MRKHICFLCAAISSKNRGLNGWAFTDVKKKKTNKQTNDNKCYIKPSTTKRNKNRKLANLHRKNDLLKATMSQRHSNYFGFVKTGFETSRPKGASAIRLFQMFGAFWSILVPFLTPSDFEGGPQIDRF
jgi:hypothetical protein